MPKPAWGVQAPQRQELCCFPRASPQRGFALGSQLSRLDENLNFQSFFLFFFFPCRYYGMFSVLWIENCVYSPQRQVVNRSEFILDVVR